MVLLPFHLFIHRQLILLLFDHISDRILNSNTDDFYVTIGIVRLIMFIIFVPIWQNVCGIM